MEHHQRIHNEFSKQAVHFGSQGLTLSSQAYLAWIVENLPLQADFRVLDVAAGTGHLSRAVAPHVMEVVALDITSAMLKEASKEMAKAGIRNMHIEEGDAARLPHRDDAFDMVVSRLAIHHFEHPALQLAEMVRVCKPNHAVGIIDLLSPDDESLIETYNRLERWRDPSHATALTKAQLVNAIEAAGLSVVKTDSRDIAVDFRRWVEMTGTNQQTRDAISGELKEEIAGGHKTGMRPYVEDGELKFLQIWSVVLATKARNLTGSSRGD